MTAVANGARRAAINDWDEGFRKLVIQTVLRPKNRAATGPELALLAEMAVRTGLDPMAKQIYGIYRYDKQVGDEVMTIQTGIDGLRTIAERTGRYAGGPAYEFCGPDKQWTDVWTETTKPVAARATVLKVIGGTIVQTQAVALWEEYGLEKNVWKDKPSHMLGKCAEALALRKAFPNDLAGLYIDEEMDRAGAEPLAVAAKSTPPATDSTAVEVPEGADPADRATEEQIGEVLDLVERVKETAGWDGPRIKLALVAAGAPNSAASVREAVEGMRLAGVLEFVESLKTAINDALDEQAAAEAGVSHAAGEAAAQPEGAKA
jgi:phage recombination protein Bet